jgi:acetylornithine deacetylase/succinyl-diaminopimelate desuccinylase-like protein
MRRWKGIAVFAVIAFAGLAVLWWHNRREGSEILSQLYVPKPERITPEIVLLQKYIRVNTTNPPGNEIEAARFLAAVLEKDGLHAEVIESAPGRGNVYARIKGRRAGEGLLLLNHMDVMPASNEGWRRPPFAASILFNMLYGRGSLDMKSIAICELEGFLEVARSGRTPERDVIFLGTADEERGGTMGMKWLLDHRPEIFEGVRYVINEGGITETKEERLSYFGVEIGTKMLVKARLRARTREELQRLRIALEPRMTPSDPDRVLPQVRQFLHEIAPHRLEKQALLMDIDRTIASGKFWLLPRGYKELTQNVVWMTTVHADGSGATAEVLLLNLPDEDPDRRIAWLRSFIAPYGASIDQILEKTGPSPLSSRHTPFFALITREVQRQYGNVTVGTEILTGSSNDSRYLRARGINCYGMWPFPVDFYQTQGIHSSDERLRLDWFMSGVELTRRLVRSYAFESAQM